MRYLVFLLEEPSAKEMLQVLVPRVISTIPSASDIEVRYIVFEGKQDLEKRIQKKLRGWRNPQSYFIVMRDQDSGDCYAIKSNLQNKVDESGKKDCTLIRIACRELEAFYLGDLAAVEKALDISGLASRQKSKKFRNPDILENASKELKVVTKKKYQKLSGSRNIAQYMSLDDNTSYSFNMLLEGIKKLLDCGGC